MQAVVLVKKWRVNVFPKSRQVERDVVYTKDSALKAAVLNVDWLPQKPLVFFALEFYHCV